jgi:pimeloyl-ACP methyl ester carboxylesterase
MRILLWIVVVTGAVLTLAFTFLGDPDVPRETLLAKYGQAPSKFVVMPSGATAHYRDQGNNAGPVLVLLHGSNASLHTWEPWAAALGNQFRVISMDLPGHGLTIARQGDDFTAASMAAFVNEFMATLSVTRYAVAGNSMGGGVAGRLTMQFPAQVSHLILVDSAGIIPANMPSPPAFFYVMRVPGLRDLARLIPGRPLAETTLKASFVNQALVTPEMIDRYWELNREPNNRVATRKRFRMPLDYYTSEDAFFRANMPKITAPTLVMWGRRDKLIPVEAASVFKDAIPGAQVVIYDDGGHILQEDLAAQSADAVRSFLSAH